MISVVDAEPRSFKILLIVTLGSGSTSALLIIGLLKYKQYLLIRHSKELREKLKLELLYCEMRFLLVLLQQIYL